MGTKVRTSNRTRILLIAGILIQLGFLFFAQSKISFMLEDLDYRKNMATGGDLTSLADIFQSLGWVFKNAGGSLLTTFCLQVTLLLGEHFADFLNVCVMFFVAFQICRVIDAKHQRFFTVGLAFTLIFGLNEDWTGSYLWQFGIVHYFYPAVWLLLYLYFFSRAVDSPGRVFSVKWGVIAGCVGFLAGFSNGGYGLVCILISVLSLLINRYLLGKLHQNRLMYGMYGSIAGTILYLISPGNYCQESVMKGVYLSFSAFPAVALAMIMLAILLRTGGFLTTSQILQLATLGGSVVLNLVIQALPIAGANGVQICTLILSVNLCVGLLYQMNRIHPRFRIYGYAFFVVTLLHNIVVILGNLVGVSA